MCARARACVLLVLGRKVARLGKVEEWRSMDGRHCTSEEEGGREGRERGEGERGEGDGAKGQMRAATLRLVGHARARLNAW